MVVEYAGMPEHPDYMAGIRHKERVYAANEIPALFVYPDDLRGPAWPEGLVKRIEQAGHSLAAAGYAEQPGRSRLKIGY